MPSGRTQGWLVMRVNMTKFTLHSPILITNYSIMRLKMEYDKTELVQHACLISTLPLPNLPFILIVHVQFLEQALKSLYCKFIYNHID